MLELQGIPFTTGRANFLDEPIAGAGRSPRVYVRIAADGLDDPFLALLDTGAEWSVLDREIAEAIGLVQQDGPTIQLRHSNGTSEGSLKRTTITLLADDGEDLAIEATVFVPNERFGRSVIGYSAFLERVRLGLDPQVNHVYFGGY